MNNPRFKSEELLLANLTTEQARDYKNHGSFIVKVKGEDYEIKSDIVVKKSDGIRYCAVVPDAPSGDQYLARKLFLENDPDEFFRVANKFWGSADERIRVRSLAPDATEQIIGYLRHELEGMGFRRDALEIRISALDYAHVYEINASYCGAYRAFRFDADHFLHNDPLNAIRHIVEDFREHLTRDVLNHVVEITNRGGYYGNTKGAVTGRGRRDDVEGLSEFAEGDADLREFLEARVRRVQQNR